MAIHAGITSVQSGSISSGYTGITITLIQIVIPTWEVLRTGKRAWAFGADDCHSVVNNRRTFNRCWIVVNSRLGPAGNYVDLSEGALQSDILQNIKTGNFYTVMRSPDLKGDTPGDGPDDIGPLVKIAALSNVIVVWTDRESRFRFSSYPSSAGSIKRAARFATYELRGDAQYVRVMVKQRRSDGELYRAILQPLFVIESGVHLHYNEPFALFVQRGKYVIYQERTYGINLGWSDSPVYQWILRKEGLPHDQQGVAVQPGDVVGLFNERAGDYVVYGEREYGINLRWLRDQHTIPRDQPYNWCVEGAPPSHFSLRNLSINKYLVYQVRKYGINLGWSDSAPDNMFAGLR